MSKAAILVTELPKASDTYCGTFKIIKNTVTGESDLYICAENADAEGEFEWIRFAKLEEMKMSIGKCNDCFWSEKSGKERYDCKNPKVFGGQEWDDDGCEQYEAAQISFGKNFGCIHFKKMEQLSE